MRFQAEIPQKDAAILQRLSKELQSRSNTELMSTFISIFEWLVSERRLGRRLASFSPSGSTRELVSPLLERVAPQNELPLVEVEWTAEELASLAALVAAPPAAPSEKLTRLMRP